MARTTAKVFQVAVLITVLGFSIPPSVSAATTKTTSRAPLLSSKICSSSASCSSSAICNDPNLVMSYVAKTANFTPAETTIQGASVEPPKEEKKPEPTPSTKPTLIAQAKAEEPKPSPSETPKPAETPTPTPTPTPQGTPASRLNIDTIYTMMNEHRAKLGLPAYEKEDRLCELARSRGPELDNEIYGSGTIHGGLTARNIPYWLTENMISQDSEQQAFNWWLNSSIHRKAIEGDYKYACGVCQGKSCAMLFTSFTPK